jgi:glycosyltransferase involved in cell wall biosynthesis
MTASEDPLVAVAPPSSSRVKKKTTVLSVVEYYIPGYKAGGPIRSVSNLADQLGDEYHFKIVTRDRDFKEERPYTGVRVNEWQRRGKADVFYASPDFFTVRGWRGLFNETPYDVLHLNSALSPRFTLAPLMLRRIGLVPATPVIVAPRGEFSPGALALKAPKKRAYLFFSRVLSVYSDVLWHATSAYEEADIRREFDRFPGHKARIVVAPNLPTPAAGTHRAPEQRAKVPGRVRIVFVSRIARKKNLGGALRLLHGLAGDVQLNIYGLMEDPVYWKECEEIIRSLPRNVQVRYHGTIEHSRIGSVMAEHDLFFLPTLGENFGHVILEAMTAGCPVLISDQTAWRELEQQNVGWDLPLTDEPAFHKILQKFVSMGATEHARMSEAAAEYASAVIQDQAILDQYRTLFSAVSAAESALAA